MKKTILFFIGFLLVCNFQLFAQQYTAVDYWKMENDPVFVALNQKQNAGESLTLQEESLLKEHKTKLADYFERLTDNEKAIYYNNRTKWTTQPGSVDKKVPLNDDEVYSGEKSMYSQYIWSSGLFGLFYGSAAVAVFDIGGGAAAGVPLLTAGASTLIPMLTVKDKAVTYNSLNLSLHGKSIGLLHGAALSLLITGDNIEDGKLVLGLATLSSIGLGRLGYNLGRDKQWSEGRVALYSHYGTIMPFEGFAIDAALKIEDPRVYALTSFVFGAGGYLIADRVANWNDFTVGDITSTQTLTTLNALLGFGILIDITDNADEVGPGIVLIPAAGALAGTIAGHFWLKDARLTRQQGRNTALAATGGAVIGLGLAAIIGSDAATPYYLLPYVTGIGSFALLVNRYKTNNLMASFEKEQKNRWDINFMPQNILINKKLEAVISSHPGKRQLFLPAISASLNF